jgi:type I restriction enzyme R subunit
VGVVPQSREMSLFADKQAWIDHETLETQAKENDLANFQAAFDNTFMNTIVTRMDADDEIFKRVLDDQDFRTLLADYYVQAC